MPWGCRCRLPVPVMLSQRGLRRNRVLPSVLPLVVVLAVRRQPGLKLPGQEFGGLPVPRQQVPVLVAWVPVPVPVPLGVPAGLPVPGGDR